MTTTPPSPRHTTSPGAQEQIFKFSSPRRDQSPTGQHVTTPVPLTVTPVTAISISSSDRPIPGHLPSTSPSMPTPNSLQATPNSLRATPDLSPASWSQASIPPIALSDAVATATSPHSSLVTSPTAMSEALSMSSKRSLVRKVSHSLRRRGSASQTSRDQSAGPTLMRRRSDSSRQVTDSGIDMDAYDDDDDDDDLSGDDNNNNNNETHDFADSYGAYPMGAGLGITNGRSSISSDPSGHHIRPGALAQGTQLTKITKAKKKVMLFRIEYPTAKLCWHPSDPSKGVYIDDISEIVYGSAADHYFEEYQASEEEKACWFSITYVDPEGRKGRHKRTMHLIAPDRDSFQTWVDQLDSVSRTRIELINGFVRGVEKSLRHIWAMEIQRKSPNTVIPAEDQKLEFTDVRQLCRKLNINCSEQILSSRFSKVDEDNLGWLDYPQFTKFIRKLLDRKEVNNIYNLVKSDEDEQLDKEAYFRFLRDEQKVDVDAEPDRWTRIFEKYARLARKPSTCPAPAIPARQTITTRSFQHMLADPEVFPALRECPASPRLDRPLNEYFISSSHNTYLTSRQYFAQASVEAYRSALRGGCRCIEIDCWDGQSGKPEVRHGSYTSTLAFADCVSVVNQYAFATCKYPLIISLEIHCCAEQQQTMVNIMKTAFGDKLLTKELVEGSEVLPSPEDLKERILLKVKYAEVSEDSTTTVDNAPQRRNRSLSSPFSRPVDKPEPLAIPISSSPSATPPSPPERVSSFGFTPKGSSIATPLSINSSSDDSDAQIVTSPGRKRHKTSKIIPALGELAVYTQGVSFRNKTFESPELQSYNHVVSLSEGTFLALTGMGKPAADPVSLVDKHNVNHLIRVYPASKRITSSNFDPLNTWRHGVQMAALNWQTYDLAIQLNRAMFAGGADVTGYSLKMDDMRPSKDEDDEDADGLPKRKGKKLVRFAIEVISAKQLPRQQKDGKDVPTNPFVDLEVYCADDKARGTISGTGGHDKSSGDGMTGLGAPLRRRTGTLYDNGHDPQFHQKFTFSVETRYPGLVFVRWVVRNVIDATRESASPAPLGTYTARLSSLQQGYRYIPLFDRNGEQYLHSSLLCHIKMNEDIQLDEPNSSVQSFATHAPILPNSPSIEPPKRSLFNRVLHRTSSDKKKRGPEKDAKDGQSTCSMSRTTSMEK